MLDIDEEARKYPLVLHRCALALLEIAAQEGHKRVWVITDPAEPKAEKWVKMLGFEYVKDEPEGKRWEREIDG